MGFLSDDSGSSTGSTPNHTSSSRGKRKILKSGMDLKSSEGVLFQLDWPHRFLQYQYVSQGLGYADLNLSLLFAGELEILFNIKSGSEMRGRINLLRILAYE